RTLVNLPPRVAPPRRRPYSAATGAARIAPRPSSGSRDRAVRSWAGTRAQPAVEPGEHLGPHRRRVGVTDLPVEHAAEPVANPERLIREADGVFEGLDPVGG